MALTGWARSSRTATFGGILILRGAGCLPGAEYHSVKARSKIVLGTSDSDVQTPCLTCVAWKIETYHGHSDHCHEMPPASGQLTDDSLHIGSCYGPTNHGRDLSAMQPSMVRAAPASSAIVSERVCPSMRPHVRPLSSVLAPGGLPAVVWAWRGIEATLKMR